MSLNFSAPAAHTKRSTTSIGFLSFVWACQVFFYFEQLSLCQAFVRPSHSNTMVASLVRARSPAILSLLPKSLEHRGASLSTEHALRQNFYRQYTKSATLLYSTTDPLNVPKEEHTRNVVQWYPGHIAKAERLLKETFLKSVDVVVEVRDARVAKATAHPKVGEWCAGRPRLVVLTHVDMIPNNCKRAWMNAYDKFGAESYHGVDIDDVDGEILNKAKQAAWERSKYVAIDNKKKDMNNDLILPVEDVLFVNAKDGSGIHALKRAIAKAGAHIQERRARRGLKGRALRVGILGYPNVGKSALINRLLGKKRARSANTPGVTRALQWIRVRSDTPDASGKLGGEGVKDFELLDSPGIIPVNLNDQQSDAVLLAACNCIGDAAYDNQEVAAYLCEWMLAMCRLGYARKAAPGWRKACIQRYKFDPMKAKEIVILKPDFFDELPETSRPRTGEDMLYDVADNTCQGDPEDAARKILQDFRAGRMGPICLQIAPRSEDDEGQTTIIGDNDKAERERLAKLAFEQQLERADAAKKAADELGLELPPMLTKEAQESDKGNDDSQKSNVPEEEVGKGLFDGW